MAPLTPDQLHQHALELMYNSSHVIGIIPQSILYGLYLCLISMSSWMMLKKGLKTRTRRFLFGMTLTMFAYSTLYMAVSIGNLILFIKGWFLDVEARGSPGDAIQLFSAIGLINYVLTDGVVVWRAWVLCRDNSPKMLKVCMFFLTLACTSVLTTVGIRIALFAVPTVGVANKKLTRAIDITQVANLTFSLITNIGAVYVVTIKAWHFRRFFIQMRVRDAKTHSSRLLALIIESGILYCISLVTVLVATVIRLPIGTLGDLYTPVNVQLAGIYPIVVLLLVNHERSLDRTIFVNSVAMHAEGMDQSSSEDSTFTQRRRADVRVSSVVFQSNPSAVIRTRMTQTSTMESDDLDSPRSDVDMDTKLEEKPLPGIPAVDGTTVSLYDSDVIEIED